MPRNFFRRIEIAFPIEDGVLRERIISEVLAVSLADNAKARVLQSDGTYLRVPLPAKQAPCRSQSKFIGLARTEDNFDSRPVDGKTKFAKVRLARSPFPKRGKARLKT